MRSVSTLGKRADFDIRMECDNFIYSMWKSLQINNDNKLLSSF